MPVWVWVAFIAALAFLVGLDLGVLSRRPRVVSRLDAVASMTLWLLAAVLVAMGVFWEYEHNILGIRDTIRHTTNGQDSKGLTAMLQFGATFLVETALSLESVAVVALIINHLKVPAPLRNRLLFWATVMSLLVRAGSVALGYQLLKFEVVNGIFAGVLVASALRMLVMPDEGTDLGRSRLLRFLRRLPTTAEHVDQRLITRVEGKWKLTPLMVAFLAVSLADAVFAFDSIPAAFALTRDPFIVFAASAIAILMMRSLYFAVEGFVGKFRFLKLTLTLLLVLLAVKTSLIEGKHYELLGTVITLLVAHLILMLGITASVLQHRSKARGEGRPPGVQGARPTALEDLTSAVMGTRKNLRKIGILIGGTAVILLGVAIAPLPGPGPTVLVPIGLAILATEFIWARRLLMKLKEQTEAVTQRSERVAEKSSPLVIPLVVVGYVGFFVLVYRYAPIPHGVTIGAACGGLFPLGYWVYRMSKAMIRVRRQRREGVPSDPPAPAQTGPHDGQEPEGPPSNPA